MIWKSMTVIDEERPLSWRVSESLFAFIYLLSQQMGTPPLAAQGKERRSVGSSG